MIPNSDRSFFVILVGLSDASSCVLHLTKSFPSFLVVLIILFLVFVFCRPCRFFQSFWFFLSAIFRHKIVNFTSQTISLDYWILLIHRRQIYPKNLCDSSYSFNVSDLFRKFCPLCLLSSIDQQMMSKDIFLNPLTITPILSILTIIVLRLAVKMWSVSQNLFVPTERDYWLLKLFHILQEEIDTLPDPPFLSYWASLALLVLITTRWRETDHWKCRDPIQIQISIVNVWIQDFALGKKKNLT